ncbi:MAG: hypothetical protein IJG00_01375 [Clostridia bacterium]|nr:hypothetical protein [Clostridia bacterium]
MKNNFWKFLFTICVIAMYALPYKSAALKFEIFVRKELNKTRITLREINLTKPQHMILQWSRLVNDKDIFVLNNMVINIPANSYAIRIIKNLAQIDEIPTSYIEDHYYEILNREERGNNEIYRYLRNRKIVKKILNNSSS